MLSWFPVDIHVRNDPKIRAVRTKYGPAGLGYLLGLWSYVATEGSKTDPGVGLDSTGQALNLDVMGADLGFASTDELRAFLDYLAGVGLTDADAWSQGFVVLPAMRKRLSVYQKTKGRTPTGRPPGRPRKTPSLDPKTPGNNYGVQGPISAKTRESEEKPGTETREIPKEITRSETLGNSGETPGNSGNSYSVVSSILPDLHLEPETRSDDQDGQDPRTGKFTVKKLVRLWNDVRSPGPKVLGVVPARYERFRLAIKATPDAADWERAIRYLNGVAWANASGEGIHANFRADLDYLAKPGNVTKALERLAAQALPNARPARHTGRVAPTGSAKDAIQARQAAEDADLKARGLL